MLDTYLDVLGVIGKSAATIEHYRYQLGKFFNWLHGYTGSDELPDITTESVSAYRDYLVNEQLKPNSVNSALTTISAFCSWMVFKGYLQQNPVDLVERMGKPETPPRWLNKSERFRVIRAAVADKNPRNTAIILMLLGAGLRVSELVRLAPNDVLISDKTGHIRVRTGTCRTIPLGSDLRRLLGKFMTQERASRRWLFGSQRSENLTEKGVQQVCTEIGDAAGVPGLTPSVLRHTFAHDLFSHGTSSRVVAALMGVSKVAQLRQYQDGTKGTI